MPLNSAPLSGRLAGYLEYLCSSLGHVDRHEPCKEYLRGLLMPGHRKSMEPMAARLSPRSTSAKHQVLQHFATDSPWKDQRILNAAMDWSLPTLRQQGGIQAWIIDDTGMPKCGEHSVGVARQYCGNLGKTDNCQVAVSVTLANEQMSIPVAWRLYLPQSWCDDPIRRKKCRVPEEVVFQTKGQIALGEIDKLLMRSIPRAPLLADAGYGTATAFRDSLTERGLQYIVGITPEVSFWPEGELPLPPKEWSGHGRKPFALRHDDEHTPISASDLAKALPTSAWTTITWREGSGGKPLTSRFACQRVRPSHGDKQRSEPREEEWLLIEWPPGEPAPTKYALSNFPDSTNVADLVALYKLRWRIEHDYLELKDQLGLDHFEGRSWRGFHHHGTLCIAAYCFIAVERAMIFPPDDQPLVQAAESADIIPRGSPRHRSET
jgi:SRSO17 transposase